ncbi:histidine phosphatase family protein [Candidatus Woesearchaeota archaeon]|nr:MAG: histidine phosphatase family protein [Candidatus Woesearchaeota archaeon]
MLELILIRHAQSEANLKQEIGGQQNHVSLTPTGREQAQKLAFRLLCEERIFDGIYTSPAVRAYDTARTVAGTLAYTKELIFAPELLERSQGDAERKRIEDVYTPETRAVIDEDPWNFRFPNGESMADVEKRVIAYIDREFIRPGKEGRYALFSHGNAIRTFLHHVLQFPAHLYWKIKLNNTGISTFTYDGEEFHLHTYNDCAHLLSARSPDK